MKKYLILFVLLSTRVVISQEIPLDLPVLSPQSPNAYQFAKYGEINVNESTGIISPSIPLYTYKSGNVSIPIVLNYSGNGVKVAQESTWTGINWNLNVGGVITRQVRDLPDEDASITKKYYTMNGLDALNGYLQYTDISTDWYKELELIGNSGLIDSEVDIFNYNFLGYSGSFYLDENLDAHLIKYDKELDIQFQYDTSGNNESVIVIKTPEGDTYFFGGSYASESSKSFTNNGGGSSALADFAQNAFYLYLVSPYNGGSTTFTYEQINLENQYYKIDTQEHLSKYVYSEGACNPPSTSYTTYSERDILSETQSKVFLKRIESSFNDTYIDFSYTSLGTRKRKLNSVQVKDANDNILKKFEFTYLTFNTESDPNENRFFLQQVDFYDKNSTKIYDYKLEYNSPESLPSKWSYARDENGYYNGKETNNTLLPIHHLFGGTITLANREVDTQKIKYGSLTKITYPTGGYSQFDYELPIIGYKADILENAMFVYHNDPTRNGESDYEDTLWFEGDAFFYLQAGETIDVNLIINTIGDLTHQNSISVSTYHNGITKEVFSLGIGNPENTSKDYNENFTITITKTGNYYFKLNFNPHETAINDNTLEITARAGFEIPMSQVQIPVYYPSLRIKNIYTYEKTDVSPIIKRYYYNQKEFIDEELNFLVNDPLYYYESKIKRGCGGFLSSYDTYNNLTASALNNIFGDDTGKILYPYVTVSYGGDNFEQGGKESKFSIIKDGGLRPYFGDDILYSSYGQNLSFANSTLLKETYFTYDDVLEQFSAKKQIEYRYSVLSGTDTMHNIKAYKIATGDGFPDIRDYNFGLYDIDSRKYALTKVTTTENFEGQTNTFTKTEDFLYDSYLGQPSTIKTTDSKGINSEKQFYYPKDVTINDENLTQGEKDLILNLDTYHRISQPYMTKEYYDNELTGSRQIIYSDEWYSNKIWPKTVKNKKDVLAPYEDRINYLGYNYYGRLEKVSITDGTITKYIYNSNQQVVQKIDNYDGVIDDGANSGPCFYQDTYPNAQVTSYEYDPDTNTLIKITDPRCNVTTYHYDNSNRLEYIKDSEGKILSKNEYHYKNQ